ncbi:flagellar hook-basal body complex protein FliE [Paenibacillus sp. TRM 82003]|nr:flagellar hook-basal body complex protein FliE [Paenibacillus sp. TRM 82003]
MEINGVKGIGIAPVTGANALGAKTGDVSKISESFGSLLERALESVNNQEKEVKVLNEQFITGQLTDVHSLMIASQKAQLGLQLTVQVRNKVIEAYQEVMRTQL